MHLNGSVTQAIHLTTAQITVSTLWILSLGHMGLPHGNHKYFSAGLQKTHPSFLSILVLNIITSV